MLPSRNRSIGSLLFILGMSAACNSANLSSGHKTAAPTAKAGETSAADSESEGKKEEAGETTAPEGQVAASPLATPPVAIAGAYLQCSYDKAAPAEAQCESLTQAGVRTDYAFSTAHIISGLNNTWAETAFTRRDVGLYSVTVPSSIQGSFAVALMNEKLEFLADWLEDPSSPIPLQLAEGSFEDYPFPDPTDKIQFFSNSAGSKWILRNAPGNTCPRADIEVHREDAVGSDGPSSGNFWVELNSSCTAVGTGIGSNIVVYQDLSLKPEHAYQILFDYRKRADGEFGVLKFRFAEEHLEELTSASNDWATYRLNVTAKSEISRIEFESAGLQSEGKGPQLDNVRVYDLGKAIISE